MRAALLVVALPCLVVRAYAAEVEPSCEQVRAQIGTPPLADPALLRTMAVRKDCAFSSAEFYRAAYGDRPPSRDGEHRHRQHDDDDDD